MSYVDLEDEDLIAADENELFIEEDGLLVEDNNENNADENNQPADNADADPATTPDTKDAPKKRVVRKPQPKLDYDRLRGPRGLRILPTWFDDIKFKGKGHEKEDLDAVMGRLEQWTHRLFPKYTFDDSLKKIETLGHKKIVMNYMQRIRLDMLEDDIVDRADDEIVDQDEPEADPFDALLDQNPGPSSTQEPVVERPEVNLSDEQRERMIRNRLLAEERRLARMKARQEELSQSTSADMDVIS